MKIALLHHNVGGRAGGGGGVRLMLELALGLTTRGHAVTIACHDYVPSSEFSYASERLEIRAVRTGISEIPAGGLPLAHRWLEMSRVARLVPDDVDVVNAHEWLALRPGRIASRRLSVPLVWTRNGETPWERTIVPEMTPDADPRWGRRLVRAAFMWPDLLDARRASAIVVLSDGQIKMVRRSYHRDAIVLGLGPPMQFFDPPDRRAARARLAIPDDAFLVLGVGVLAKHRRFDTLIDAIDLLSDDPSVQALILGSDHEDPAYADRLAAHIERRGLVDRIALPRRSVSDQELKDAYAAADVFVILSRQYSWGLAPLEALASGTPVIITPGAGVHDILAGRPGVQVVDGGDAEGTAAALRRWRSSDGRARIESTRAYLRAEYSMDAYVERMERIYSSARGAAPPGAAVSRCRAPAP
jgi:glycosyltransferase involved in cell wall biosynthesis